MNTPSDPCHWHESAMAWVGMYLRVTGAANGVWGKTPVYELAASRRCKKVTGF